ncbi:MAG: hypothetical protein WCK28_00025 [Burkholderiales bacterium]
MKPYPSLLEVVAEALALAVSDRTVRRWVAGTSDVPAGLYVDLLRLVTDRAQTLDDLTGRLRAAGG